MLISEDISRVWQCDGLGCPNPPVTSQGNPFYRVSIHLVSVPGVGCSIDLCAACIETITAPKAVDYVGDPT